MRGISKLTDHEIIGEFDSFPDYLYFVTFEKNVIEKITNLVISPDKQSSGYIEEIKNEVLNFFHKESNTLYVPGILVDELFFNENKDTLIKQSPDIFCNFLGVDIYKSNSEVEEFGLYNHMDLSPFVKVVKIENKNIRVKLPKLTSIESSDGDGFSVIELVSDELSAHNVTVGNVSTRFVINISYTEFIKLLSSSVNSGTVNTIGGSYRFYRKTLTPLVNTVLSNGYNRSLSNRIDTEFSLFNEEDYQYYSSKKDFKVIKEKSNNLYDRRNYTSNLDDLVPGCIYALPHIKYQITRGSAYTPGYSHQMQLLYLGKIYMKDKPEFPWDLSGSNSLNLDSRHLFNFGFSVFYESDRASLTGDRASNKLFGGVGYSPNSKTLNNYMHVFLNTGQLAFIHKDEPYFYTADYSKIDTADKFIEYFVEKIMPDLFSSIKNYYDNKFEVVRTSYFRSSRFTSGGVSSDSPTLITLTNKDMELIAKVKTAPPPFVKLMEVFDGSKLDLTTLFNRITTKSLDIFQENGIKLHISEDSRVVKPVVGPNTCQGVFSSSGLSFLPWVTPELYNSNEAVKNSIINHLKNRIHLASSVIINLTGSVFEFDEKELKPQLKYKCDRHNSKDKFESLRKFLNSYKGKFVTKTITAIDTDGSNIVINDSKPATKVIIETAGFHNHIFGYSTYRTRNNARMYPINSVMSRWYDNIPVSGNYVDTLIEMISRDESTRLSFLDMIQELKNKWDDIKTLHKDAALSPEDLAFILQANLEEINQLDNIVYNWFVDCFYDYYKQCGKLKDTEMSWIDKFGIQNLDLKNFEITY